MAGLDDHDDETGSTYRGDPDPMADPGTPGAADTGLDEDDDTGEFDPEDDDCDDEDEDTEGR